MVYMSLPIRVLTLMAFVFFFKEPYGFAQKLYGPRDFVSAAPASLFYTDDEMSEREKQALVKGGFQKTQAATCDNWVVMEEREDRIVLQYCPDSRVIVQVYRNSRNPQSGVVAVASVRASGRATDLELYRVENGRVTFVPLESAQRGELGLVPLTENDFVVEAQRFPEAEARVVRLTLDGTGKLLGEPATWMDPRWEKREQAYEVAFVWTQNRFVKVKREISGG